MSVDGKSEVIFEDVLSLGVQEEHHLRAAKELRHHTVERLWKITEELNILYKDNWTALANREIVKFQKELMAAELLQLTDQKKMGSGNDDSARRKAVLEEGDMSRSSNNKILTTQSPPSSSSWSFSDSFLYSLSLITTVGKFMRLWLQQIADLACK